MELDKYRLRNEDGWHVQFDCDSAEEQLALNLCASRLGAPRMTPRALRRRALIQDPVRGRGAVGPPAPSTAFLAAHNVSFSVTAVSKAVRLLQGTPSGSVLPMPVWYVSPDSGHTMRTALAPVCADHRLHR